MHREEKIKLTCFSEHLIHTLTSSYSSHIPINIGSRFSLLKTSLGFCFLQQQNKTSLMSPNSLIPWRISWASITSLAAYFVLHCSVQGSRKKVFWMWYVWDSLASFIMQDQLEICHWINCKKMSNFMLNVLFPSWLKWLYIYFLIRLQKAPNFFVLYRLLPYSSIFPVLFCYSCKLFFQLNPNLYAHACHIRDCQCYLFAYFILLSLSLMAHKGYSK